MTLAVQLLKEIEHLELLRAQAEVEQSNHIGAIERAIDELMWAYRGLTRYE